MNAHTIEINAQLTSIVACPECRAALNHESHSFTCSVCRKVYSEREGKLFFTDGGRVAPEVQNDALVYRIKNWLKKHFPSMFFMLYHMIALFVGKSARTQVEATSKEAVILNIGSGAKSLGERVIHVDIEPEPEVDVVANAYSLPFKDSSSDLIVSESLLEHLEYPEKAVAEMHRVLKHSGTLYILTPFMLGFHSSPHDYFRWTIPGMKILLKDFDVYESGVAIGPTSALLALLREWLAILLSFNNRTLYQLWTMVFMILFIPFNLIDLTLARFHVSSNISLAYYFIARKK